jgi:outer membrane protein OmpA-like peptidoglycan-associated protein
MGDINSLDEEKQTEERTRVKTHLPTGAEKSTSAVKSAVKIEQRNRPNALLRRLRPLMSILLISGLALGAMQLSADQSVKDLNSIIRSLAPIDGQNNPAALDLDIRFELGSSRLSSSAHRQLDELGAALTSEALQDATIGIYGHTDAKGSSSNNQKLSQARAQSVADYLIASFSINPNRLEVKGFGEERLKNPIAPDAAENRRVEVVNLSPALKAPETNDAFDQEGKIRW